MVWGLERPSGFGICFPHGDYPGWEERLEACHGSQPVAVLAAEDEAARRLRGLHVQDEVAVHDRLGLTQREHDALRRLHELDGLRRVADVAGIAQALGGLGRRQAGGVVLGVAARPPSLRVGLERVQPKRALKFDESRVAAARPR